MKTWVQSLDWDDPLGKGPAPHPTPVFWPQEFHGLYSPRGHREPDTTEQLSLLFASGLPGRLQWERTRMTMKETRETRVRSLGQ